MKKLLPFCIALLVLPLLGSKCDGPRGIEKDCPQGQHWAFENGVTHCVADRPDDNRSAGGEAINGLGIDLSDTEGECFNTQRAGLYNSNNFKVQVTVLASPTPPNWPPSGKKDVVVPASTPIGSPLIIGDTKYKSFQDCTFIYYNIVDRKRVIN